MTRSLRLRLFLIILAPLMVMSLGLGAWRVSVAQDTAQELYDRNLLFTALAVSRDVVIADGDAISPETERLLGATAGGPVRYHVYAPDGVFVTGYAEVPVPILGGVATDEAFTYFDGIYKDRDMRVLRLKYLTEIGGFPGTYTITVWQDKAVRGEFVNALALRTLAVIAALIGTTAALVWFGVNLGLKPLLDLEDAISRRNPEDLSPIRRSVPPEIGGLVQRLNHLFQQVTRSMEAQAAFISDASHQLRNPIAGIRALGASIQTAGSLETARDRARDLVEAAEQAGELAQNLMTLERLRADPEGVEIEPVDLAQIARELAGEFRLVSGPVAFRTEVPEGLAVPADSTLLREALRNLVHNAEVHGGSELSRITLSARTGSGTVTLTVADDGRGVRPEDFEKVLARFGQADPGKGSGLGLSIAEAIAERHGGRLTLDRVPQGFSASLHLPAAA